MKKYYSKSLALLACTLILSFSTAAKAQVLEDPQNFVLPPLANSIENSAGVPSTLDIGDIDASVVTDIGGLPLNDVAIMTVVSGIPVVPNLKAITTFTGNGRIYTLIHTSGSNTRALQLLNPVDVPIDSICYVIPSSLHILDLNGDDTNDLAFTSNCDTGSNPVPGNVYGIEGASSDPFQVPSSLAVLGSQNDGAFLLPSPPLPAFQLNLATGDYDGNGKPDLAFYDATNASPAPAVDQIHALLNNGTIGILPNVLSTITGPETPPTMPTGILVTSGDFDDNGTQDMAIVFLTSSLTSSLDNLFVYSGNGDGTFAQDPVVQVNLGQKAKQVLAPFGFTAGNFNNDGFSDFAVSTAIANEAISNTGSLQISLVLCSPGNPVSCTVTDVAKTTLTSMTTSVDIQGILASGDFNNDGLDDLANASLMETFDAMKNPIVFEGLVNIRLNHGGSFNDIPDQSLPLNLGTFEDSAISQVVVKDIDGCGGPDVAFTGLVFNPTPEPTTLKFISSSSPTQKAGSLIGSFEFQAEVAFNPNEAPVADAGPDNGTPVSSGIQIGGNPTCSDPTNDSMLITWTQLSGDPATLNDPHTANPIIVTSSGFANGVFQVTCTDACGLSDSDTVSVSFGFLGFLQGSGCSLGLNGNTYLDREALSWGLIMIAFGALSWKSLRRS